MTTHPVSVPGVGTRPPRAPVAARPPRVVFPVDDQVAPILAVLPPEHLAALASLPPETGGSVLGALVILHLWLVRLAATTGPAAIVVHLDGRLAAAVSPDYVAGEADLTWFHRRPVTLTPAQVRALAEVAHHAAVLLTDHSGPAHLTVPLVDGVPQRIHVRSDVRIPPFQFRRPG